MAAAAEQGSERGDSAGLGLYRCYRPRAFSELVGQAAVARTLENAIKTGRVHHAYLFVGSRGTGKTSTAKILAACLNCAGGPTPSPCGSCASCRAIAAGSSLDVVELDAASHNSVEDVRALRETIAYAPAASYRVYILDEAHMLSNAAWNALLKTLEEPPPRTVFVLATTEAQRVPATVVDRCQRFDFRRPTVAEIAEVVRRVAAAEGIGLEEEAVVAIARQAAGSFRDALGLLEQLVTYAGPQVRAQDVLDLYGGIGEERAEALLEAIGAGDAATALSLVGELVGGGLDPQALIGELEERARELLVVAVVGAVPEELSLGRERDDRRLELARAVGEERLLALLDRLGYAREAVRAGAAPRTQLELAVVKAARGEGRGPSGSVAQLAARVASLERAVAALQGAAQPSAAPPEQAGQPASALPDPPSVQKEGVGEDPPPAEPRQDEPGFDLAAAVDCWERAVERVRERNALVGSYFEVARPVRAEGERLTIGFAPGETFARKQAERPENVALLTTTLRELLGSPLSLSFDFDERLAGAAAGDEEELIKVFIDELEAEELPAEGGG